MSRQAFYKLFKETPLDELNKKFRARLRRDIDEDFRQRQLRAVDDGVKRMEERTAELEKDRVDTEAKLQALMKNERAFEDRRVTDVKSKLKRIAATCDLLIIPRHTLINTTEQQLITPSLFSLSPAQVEVVKDFMKQGKPVLACVGPNIEPRQPAGLEPLDDFEKLLGDRGIELGRQAVMFDVEAKAFAARRAGDMLGGTPIEIPPVNFPDTHADKKANPIAAAMAATSRSADQQLELRLRHPRPIYLAPGIGERLPFAADFMSTSPASWNEEQPFGSMRQVSATQAIVTPPRYDATPFDDPKRHARRGTPGPFTAVAMNRQCRSVVRRRLRDNRKAATISNGLDGGLLKP